MLRKPGCGTRAKSRANSQFCLSTWSAYPVWWCQKGSQTLHAWEMTEPVSRLLVSKQSVNPVFPDWPFVHTFARYFILSHMTNMTIVEFRRIYDEWKASGLTIQKYCESTGFSESRFCFNVYYFFACFSRLFTTFLSRYKYGTCLG